MSQMRAIQGKVRSLSAVAAVCALLFGLLVSGAARGPLGALAGSGVSTASSCHLLSGAPADIVRTDKTAKPARDGGGHMNCPQCCLAMATGSAVLPERVATMSRPPQLLSSPVRYSAAPAPRLQNAASGAVNGARAPPSPVRAS